MFKFAIVLFGAVTWLSVLICALLFPAADSLLPRSYDPGYVASAFALSAFGILAYAVWLRKPPNSGGGEYPENASVLLPVSLAAQTAVALCSAFMVHRDYITLTFQSFCLHYIIFLRLAPGMRSAFFFQYADRLYSFTKGIIVFFLAWISLMGYAIAVRGEPRWIPAIVYNVVNLALCFLLYAATLNLHRKTRREVVLSESGFLIDGLDLTALINPSILPIVRFLVERSPSDQLTCRDAQILLGKKPDCDDCTKAMLCPEYKYLYNRMHELKRVFSALRVGTIADRGKGRDIREEGWTFLPDPSIVVVKGNSSKIQERGVPKE